MPATTAVRSRLAALLLVPLFAVPAPAQDCFDYATTGLRDLGTVPTGLAFDLVAKDGILYAACGWQGVSIWDVSAPGAPALLARIDGLPGAVNRIDCDGADLVAVVEGVGLMLWDVTTPDAPVLAGVHAEARVEATAVGGGRVYVSDWTQAVMLTRGTTAVMDTASVVFGAYDVGDALITGDLLVVAPRDGTAEVLGLLPSGEVTHVGWFNFTAPLAAMALDGDWLYAAVSYPGYNAGINAVDFSDPAQPQLQPGQPLLPLEAYDLALAPGLAVALMADPHREFWHAVIYDRTNPAQPERLGEVALDGEPTAIAATAGALFVARSDGDVRAIDLTDRTTAPLHPVPALWGAEYNLDLDGDVIFAGADSYAYRTIDAATGEFLYEDDVPGVRALDAHDSRLLVAYDGPRLAWIDVSDPAHPAPLADLPLPALADLPENVLLGYDRAVVCFGARDLVFYALPPGGQPAITGSMTLPANASDAMAWWGDDLLVRLMSPMPGLALVGYTNSYQPRVSDWMSGYGYQFAVAGDRAYVPATSGLLVLQRDEYGRLTQTGSVAMAYPLDGVAVAGGTLYAASYHYPVQVFSLEDPDAPAFLGTGPQSSGGFRLRANVRWLAWMAWWDVVVSPAQCAAEPVAEVVPETPGMQVRVVPNPMNPGGEIQFVVAEAGPVWVTVYDLRGRVVRRLVEGRMMEVGAVAVFWDGRDDVGREVASGAFAVRAREVAGEEVAKTVVVR